MLQEDLEDAMPALAWGAGSLNGLGFDQFWPMLTVLLLLLHRPRRAADCPQTHRGLRDRPGMAAPMGVPLLATADAVAISMQLPVGVITVSIGGSYLHWLLISEYRRRR